MIIDDFGKAVGQIGDPGFRLVLFKALGLTVLLLGGFYMTVALAVQVLLPETMTLPWIGEIEFLPTLLSWLALLTMLVVSVFLMVPVAGAFTGFFLEDIASAVEAKHYDGLAPAPPLSFAASMGEALRFLTLLVFVNLLAIVLYFASTIFAPVMFWVVNGLLLGREYFQLVAMRRLGRVGANALRRKHFFKIWLAGILMAVPLTIPLINLLIPILGVATFTHMFHRLGATEINSSG